MKLLSGHWPDYRQREYPELAGYQFPYGVLTPTGMKVWGWRLGGYEGSSESLSYSIVEVDERDYLVACFGHERESANPRSSFAVVGADGKKYPVGDDWRGVPAAIRRLEGEA